MEEMIKEIEKQLAALGKFKEKVEAEKEILMKYGSLEEAAENMSTSREARIVITMLLKIIDIEWGKAIDEFSNALKKGKEKEIELKEKKADGVRSKILKLEESLLAQEKKIIKMDKRFKKTMEEMRKAYNYSKKFGDQFQ